MRIHRLLALEASVVAVIALACASDTPGGTPAASVWVRPEDPGWRESKFRGDRVQCRTQAGSVHVDRTRQVFEQCLADRGYTLVSEEAVAECMVPATGTYWDWPEAFCRLKAEAP